ncbi:hypothetical protein EJ04DRAFT_559137 [Polyplosphaeria fusca]|uniref:DUF7580 domain-containing protein n=1 Tax=Polyplosphaeria fusca TaxID=682080 RepID=A0A9P4V503_9PLEO|nr:hypothetical protein EJ04DRAFT_559137 [Polyplosphaeria fusca]
MSGFEVAGVILSSLPLIISAMEHYAEGINTAKRFWRFKSEMRSLILQVNTERGIFINTLEQLLTGIVRVEQMAQFLAAPGGEGWQNFGLEVEAKLRDRLRGAYDLYVGNVEGMERALSKIVEKLRLGADGKPQFSDPNAFKQEYRRLKFSISKSEYAEHLDKVKNFNHALTRLTKQSLELEPARKEARTTPRPNFAAFQNYARSLFATIRAGMKCGCSGHAVNLRLEHRNEEFEEEELFERTPFRVVFSYTTDQQHPVHTVRPWTEADIRCMSKASHDIFAQTAALNVSHTTTTGRRVRFESIELQSARSQAEGATRASSQTSSLPSQIQDLCEAIIRLQQPQRDLCVGYLLDNFQRRHGIYLLQPTIPTSCHWKAYSLRDILEKQVDSTAVRRLSQSDKLRIAVDLASSALQLHKTPWLSDEWRKDDVFFIQRPGATPASIYEHPFVRHRLKSGNGADALQAPMVQKPTFRVIRNQTLYTLGILLIELWYGKPINQLKKPSDLDCQGTPGVEWCTADRLVENDIEFEAGKRYSDAVRRCIRCDFDRKDTSLDNEGFQHAVYDGVVALLEKTWQQFNSLD